MNIILDNKREFTDKFINWLIDVVQSEVFNNLKVGKLARLEIYMNENKSVKDHSNRFLSAREIVLSGIQDLEFYRTPNNIFIRINPTDIYYGTDIKLEDLCKLINYGTVDIPGYPIFTNEFKYVSENINNYFNAYLEEVTGK